MEPEAILAILGSIDQSLKVIAASLSASTPRKVGRGFLTEPVVGAEPFFVTHQSHTHISRIENGGHVPIECKAIEMTISSINLYQVKEKSDGERPWHTQLVGESQEGLIPLDFGSTSGAASCVFRALAIASDDQLMKPIVLTFKRGSRGNGVLAEVRDSNSTLIVNSVKGRWRDHWEEVTLSVIERIDRLHGRTTGPIGSAEQADRKPPATPVTKATQRQTAKPTKHQSASQPVSPQPAPPLDHRPDLQLTNPVANPIDQPKVTIDPLLQQLRASTSIAEVEAVSDQLTRAPYAGKLTEFPAIAQQITAAIAQKARDLSPQESVPPQPVDLNSVIADTDLEMTRLHWSVTQGQECLAERYDGKHSRHQLTVDELIDFRDWLRQQPSPSASVR